MSSRRAPVLLVGAIAAVLAVAGCGSGGSNDTTTAVIGKAEFIQKANAICTKSGEKMHADFLAFSNEKNNNPTPSKAEYEEFINRVIEPDLTRQITEIRALGSPKGDEGNTEELFEAIAEGLEKAKAKPEWVTTHNSEFFERAIKLATQYGLSACAQTY